MKQKLILHTPILVRLAEAFCVFFQITTLMESRTMFSLNEFDITNKQVLKSNYLMWTRDPSHIWVVGYERFGASARLFNDEAKGA